MPQHERMLIDEPTNKRREPCAHGDLVWTSLDSAYCTECGQELVMETSQFLCELATIARAYPQETA